MSSYGAGSLLQTVLTGAELVDIDNGGSVKVRTTTGAIAALSGNGITQDILNTAVTTVGNGTLTAAALLGGLITRTGPVAAFTDTTDSAANIVAAIGVFSLGGTFPITYKNVTAFTSTLAAGANVTVPVTNMVGPFQEVQMYGVIGGTAAAPTVTFNHLQTGSISGAPSVTTPLVTTIATNGAGSLTAAAITGGYINRTTVAAAFTDTTDTAANIIAANPALVAKIGASFIFVYANNSTGVATLTGGAGGVTVSGVTTVPPGVVVQYLMTYTAANTMTMVGIGSTEISPNQIVIGGATSGQVTITAPAVAGAATLAFPPIQSGTLQSTSGTNLADTDVYRCTTAQTANTNVVPATVTGLVSNTLAIGTYKIRLVLYTTIASGTAGIAITGLLTTTVMGAGNFVSVAYLAATMTTTAATAVASPISLYTAAAIPLQIIVEGTFTVTTAGTLTIQMCQNTSNASNSTVNVGSYMELTRIA